MLSKKDYLNNTTLNIFMEHGARITKDTSILQLAMTLGPSMCKSLSVLDFWTGCDYNSSFYKKRQKPFKVLKNNVEYQEMLTALGEAHNWYKR